MESTIVIKVKYGETLRRFNASIVDENLDLDMEGLREKVLRLFDFAPDAVLTLTYIDEDGDVVTLVDEEDLQDVMRQSLNPLRITARLNTDKSGRSYTRSSGSSTPMRSPRVQHPLQNLNSSVSEILKSVPEPFRESISKLSNVLASKGTSSAPGLAELVDTFSKMGLTYLNQVSEFQAGAKSRTQGEPSGSTMAVPVTKDQKGSIVDGTTSEMLSNANSDVPTLKDNQVLPNAEFEVPTLKSNEGNLGNVARGVEALFAPAPGYVNLPGGNCSPGFMKVKKLGECHFSGKSDKNKQKKSSECHHVFGVPSPYDYLKRYTAESPSTNLGGGIRTQLFNDSGNSAGSHLGLNPNNECPFAGIPLANDSVVQPFLPSPNLPRVVPFNRSHSHSDGIGSRFHRNVRCDGCGVHPITGPRFKSKVKENYDLCSICFAEMGNENDYIRMDHPLTYRQPSSFKGMCDSHSQMRPPSLAHRHIVRGCGMKPLRPKLDSRFIQDVNILDGTIMAPSTPFTKIWRMRNNGTIVWPQGSQLLWIGGDRLSHTISIEVEIPAKGLPVDKELDIAVDFTAPELPGRYISYWRMASPSGQMFGQRVWVLIQVDPSLNDSCENIGGLNLNLPPASSGITGPEVINVNAEPMVEDSLPEPDNSNRVTELVEPIVDPHPNRDQELYFPINDTLLVGGGVSSLVPSKASSSLSHPIGEIPVPTKASSSAAYPIIDFSEVAPTEPATAKSPTTVVKASAPEVGGTNDVEQTLLRELEEMGFRQVDLNKEILRMNEYNLEQSVDDLCGVAEWDPILEELQEMGFSDKETNKRLLEKNNGSMKRVVMDLIAGERA